MIGQGDGSGEQPDSCATSLISPDRFAWDHAAQPADDALPRSDAAVAPTADRRQWRDRRVNLLSFVRPGRGTLHFTARRGERRPGADRHVPQLPQAHRSYRPWQDLRRAAASAKSFFACSARGVPVANTIRSAIWMGMTICLGIGAFGTMV